MHPAGSRRLQITHCSYTAGVAIGDVPYSPNSAACSVTTMASPEASADALPANADAEGTMLGTQQVAILLWTDWLCPNGP